MYRHYGMIHTCEDTKEYTHVTLCTAYQDTTQWHTHVTAHCLSRHSSHTSRDYRMIHTCHCAPHVKTLQNDTHMSMCTTVHRMSRHYRTIHTFQDTTEWYNTSQCAPRIRLQNDAHISGHYRMIHTFHCAPHVKTLQNDTHKSMCTAYRTTERCTHFRKLQNDTYVSLCTADRGTKE